MKIAPPDTGTEAERAAASAPVRKPGERRGTQRPMPNSGGSGADPRSELVDHLPALRAFAISLTRDGSSADDLVQDTIVKAWTNIEKFQPGTNLRAWLFTILRNSFYSARRKVRREVSDVDGLHAQRLATRPDHDGRLALADFRVAFEQLPVEQREVLILVGASGFSYEDAAGMTGVALGTVKSRANRGRRRLAELLHLAEGEDVAISDAATMAVMTASQSPGT